VCKKCDKDSNGLCVGGEDDPGEEEQEEGLGKRIE